MNTKMVIGLCAGGLMLLVTLLVLSGLLFPAKAFAVDGGAYTTQTAGANCSGGGGGGACIPICPYSTGTN